ncbi:ubiquitin-like domain-containing protein [Fredinandcohnia sp. QZ13]|uniref:ubiquitin-like domain-containing protein n=1 Tax=Fredinandcohnia sp. QZ13 TaxID=3073144 RepID=UPI0028534B2D|nr:ubiquitin-like domain-containing protein [Fredinandcohnia sp. QZ13]MDR4888497.1 ubiquitin-like domain-containing protein [Fredinandcohnia sp. QZ13]
MLTNMKKLFSESKHKKRLIVSISSFIVLVGAGSGYAAYETTKDTVTLSLNGKEQVIRTHAKTVAEVLQDLEIDVSKHDELSPSMDTAIKDNLKVTWQEAIPVEIVVDNQPQKVWTTVKNVEDLFKDAKVEITEHDKVNPSLDTKLTKDMKVEVEKAFQLTLNDGGTEKQVWSTSTTVADFLKGQNVALNELDRVEPGMEEQITANSVVNVVRVEKVTDVVEESVAFGVVRKKDNNIDKGKEKVVTPGQEGKVAKHYEVVLENGKEVSRDLIKTETLADSKDKVVAVGTREIVQQVSRGTANVAKEFYVSSTAYTAYCSGCSGTTATGINLRANPNVKVIAVDPSIIPLGTKVYVEGYGYAIAADKGTDIKGYKIDVFFSEKSQAFRWGQRKVKIQILN